MIGFLGSNTLWGANGNDVLIGFVQDSTTVADLGGGTLVFPLPSGLANNYLFGGAGDDIMSGLVFNGGVHLSNGTAIADLEPVFAPITNYLDGGDGNDLMMGNCYSVHNTLTNINGSFNLGDSPVIMYGGNGNDFMLADQLSCEWFFTNVTGVGVFHNHGGYLSGGAGDDTLIGSFGGGRNCVYDSGSVTTTEFGGTSTLDGGTGNDLLIGDMQACRIDFNLTFSGSCISHLGDSTLIGGAGNDTLIGDIQYQGYKYVLDVNGNPVFGVDGQPVIDWAAGSVMDATCIGGDNILYGGEGDDVLVGGNQVGPEPTVLGHNTFVFDGLIDNGNDTILDFHVGLDILVGQHGATFTNGGLVGGNLVINVHDAGVDSTITLANIHTDIFNSIVQSNATVVA